MDRRELLQQFVLNQLQFFAMGVESLGDFECLGAFQVVADGRAELVERVDAYPLLRITERGREWLRSRKEQGT